MLLVTMPLWSIVCFLTFEIARRSGSYDYRTMTRELLGRWNWLYEVTYLAAMLVVVSVVAAAGGEIVSRSIGLPYAVGVLAIMVAVGWLVLKGTNTVVNFLSFWSLALYAVYVLVLIAAFRSFGPEITAALSAGEVTSDWALGGAEYMAYNVGTLPAVLFCAHHLRTRRDAMVAGVLAGPIGIIPAVLFFIAIAGLGPGMVEETTPFADAAGQDRVTAPPLRLPGHPVRNPDRDRDQPDPRGQRTSSPRDGGERPRTQTVAPARNLDGGAAGRHPVGAGGTRRPDRNWVSDPDLWLLGHLHPAPALVRNPPPPLSGGSPPRSPSRFCPPGLAAFAFGEPGSLQ